METNTVSQQPFDVIVNDTTVNIHPFMEEDDMRYKAYVDDQFVFILSHKTGVWQAVEVEDSPFGEIIPFDENFELKVGAAIEEKINNHSF